MTALNSNKFDEALKDLLRANERLLGLITEQNTQKRKKTAKPSTTATYREIPSSLDFSIPEAAPLLSLPRRRAPAQSANSHHYTRVYIAGAQGLKALSDVYGLSLFKIGTTNTDLPARLRQLNADGYASVRKINDKIIVDKGFDDWRFMPLDYQVARGPQSAVWVEQRTLRVRLPANLSSEQFETLLRARLVETSLTAFSQTENGAAHFEALGIKPESVTRFTPYVYGADQRLSEAQELYIFRYRADLSRLCHAIDTIVSTYSKRNTNQIS